MLWLDTEAKNPDERYKLLSFYRCFDRDYHYYPFKPKHAHDDPTSVPLRRSRAVCLSDGLHWRFMGETSHSGDNTTFFYNPFRRKWVYSMRTFSALDSRVRVRGYYELDDLFKGRQWKPDDIAFGHARIFLTSLTRSLAITHSSTIWMLLPMRALCWVCILCSWGHRIS